LSVFFWSVRGAHGCAFRAMLRPLSLIRALCAGAIRPHVPESTFRLSPLLASLALVLGCGAAHAAQAPLALQRGVNVQEWLNLASPAQADDLRRSPYLKEIKASGFDFIRLSVDPGALLESEGRGLNEAAARLEEAVRLAVASGLKVVLALKSADRDTRVPAETPQVPVVSASSDRSRMVVVTLAAMLARVDTDGTALEFTSEPDESRCDGASVDAWEASVAGLVRAAHHTAPDVTLILSGACGGSAKGLIQLDPAAFGDGRLLYGFHFYEPVDFTHQGLGPAKDVKGAPWPADAVAKPLALVFSKLLISRDETLSLADQDKRIKSVRHYLDGYLAGAWEESRLKARFSEVRIWAERHQLPPNRLFLASFGVMPANQDRGGALDADRFRWLSAVRREAEDLGAAWTYSELPGRDISDDKHRRPDPAALRALGLAPSALN